MRPAHRCIAGYSLAGAVRHVGAVFKPTCLMRLRARRARCGTQTSRNTSRPASSSVRCGVHTSRLGRRRRAHRAAFCAAWPTARSALSLPFEAKGVQTAFESNPGNHFREPDVRMAKAICWAVSNCGEDSLSNSKACGVETSRVVGGNSERFAECLRYCSFRCECSACRRFPINVDDCRLTPLIADRSSLLQSFPYFFCYRFFLMDRASVFLHATT